MTAYFKKSIRDSEESDMYTKVTMYMPKTIFEEVKALAEEKRLPVSKLLTFAADNELDQQQPFAYNDEWPQAPYIEDKFVEQASKVLKIIRKVPGGLSRDALLLLRREVGLSRIDVLEGLRELLEKNIVQEYKNPKSKFKYGGEYFHYRIMPIKEEKFKAYGAR